MKVKITEIACKFAVKWLWPKKMFWELPKEGNAFNKTPLTESVFIKIYRIFTVRILRILLK